MNEVDRIQRNALLVVRQLSTNSQDPAAALTSLIEALGLAAGALMTHFLTAEEAWDALTKKENPPHALFVESFDRFRKAMKRGAQ